MALRSVTIVRCDAFEGAFDGDGSWITRRSLRVRTAKPSDKCVTWLQSVSIIACGRAARRTETRVPIAFRLTSFAFPMPNWISTTDREFCNIVPASGISSVKFDAVLFSFDPGIRGILVPLITRETSVIKICVLRGCFYSILRVRFLRIVGFCSFLSLQIREREKDKERERERENDVRPLAERRDRKEARQRES